MTETQNTEALAATYGMYGNRQDEFGYLCAESQAEIIEYCHALANLENYARGLQVAVIMPSGTVITRAELDAEMTAARAPRVATLAPMTTTDPMYTGFYGVGHFA
jgi:hypothetical protein